MFRLDDAEQGAPKVDDQQLGFRGGLRPNDLAAQGPQRGSLSTLVVSEDQQMRMLLEIDWDRLQSALLETEQDPRAEFITRPVDDGVVVHVGGQ